MNIQTGMTMPDVSAVLVIRRWMHREGPPRALLLGFEKQIVADPHDG